MSEPRPARRRPETDVEAAIENADIAVSEVRAQRRNAEIVRVLVESARAWCSAAYPPRVAATVALAAANRVEPAMISAGLDAIFGVIDEAGIDELLRREVENPAALEPAASGSTGERLLGPRLAYLATAGNLPGQAVPFLVCAALARTAVVVRDSSRQPGLTRAFVQTVHGLDATLADTFVTIDGSRGVENEYAAARAARVEISGSDETVHALGKRFRRVTAGEIVLHGSRTSVAVVAPEADLAAAARAIARDVAMYEGRGCLSPHTAIVEGPGRAFEAELARALAEIEVEWPRRKQSLAEETARRAFVDAAELRALADGESRLLRANDDAWCVAVDPAGDVASGPGHRCVRVIETSDRDATLERISKSAKPPAGVAIAGIAEPAAIARFAALGATWVCPAGRLQRPPLHWRPDGGGRLAGLLATAHSNST